MIIFTNKLDVDFYPLHLSHTASLVSESNTPCETPEINHAIGNF